MQRGGLERAPRPGGRLPEGAGQRSALAGSRRREGRVSGSQQGRENRNTIRGSGHYSRTLVTRVGKLELRVPQDRQGRFSTQIFERYQRSEKGLVSALSEIYVQGGVSTRKVKAITEELCGQTFSAATISEINKRLDGELKKFSERELDQE